MYWANFLHIYQPPTQTEEIVRKVTHEGYRTLIKVLQDSPNAKITLNISAILTEQLARYGLDDVISGLRNLAEKGQIEFTGSAMYHPILPLIPRDEAIRQIELNTRVNRSYFGDIYAPRGFFPPEMCYSLEVAQIVQELGFQWIIIDETSYNGKIGSAKDDTIYTVEGAGDLTVFFKERPFSAGITYGQFPNGPSFLKALKDRLDRNSYLLTGTDGEVYGHHRPGQEKLLLDIWADGQPPSCMLSELIDLFPGRKKVRPIPSSWSTWEDELAQGIPYPQWDYPGHDLHRLQWQLTRFVLQTLKSVPRKTKNYTDSRRLLDEGLHSCQFWWASCRPWWDTGMVEWGARKLFDAIANVRDAIPAQKFQQAEDLFNSIVSTARLWQDSGEAKRRKKNYLSEHGEVSTELTFGGGSQA